MATAGALTLAVVQPYADGPPAAHTGGFGEPSCQHCHFDAPANTGSANLLLSGLPDAFVPGQLYRLTVSLKRANMRRAGFQLSARNVARRQAGVLIVLDSARTKIALDSITAVQYLSHTRAGTALSGAGASWTFAWRAPVETVDSVIFHIAANAANDDNSEFGDFIHTATRVVRPARAEK